MDHSRDVAVSSNGDAFSGVLVLNADRLTERKSIAICGLTRGGTSFAASVFARLGVPFLRHGEAALRASYEHPELKSAFLEKDFERLGRLAAEFSAEHAVWAWKLPAIFTELEKVGQIVPNPHFVMIFKEPLSVAVRKHALKGREPLIKMQDILEKYQRMAMLSEKTEHPMLLMSYDHAMSHLERFLLETASFAGISSFDVSEVATGIREDQQQYLHNWAQQRERRAALQERRSYSAI
jgi:hypothetical protein